MSNENLVTREHFSVETVATTVEQVADFPAHFIELIVNDGSEDIYFNLDGPTTADNKFTLKPFGAKENWPRACQRLYFRSASGEQPFRAWGRGRMGRDSA